ncbi:gamma-aminobutyric acid receptor alpha-like, partial [Amphibalanus amphitrite]|uniref:gamma-aminobutyric acid receptor alpha-like n=1 Tax=Amphibalanus amphitrite TaxID=1232801 RepID=UPI001C91D4F0
VWCRQHNSHSRVSELLDSLLRGYDNSMRPDMGGPPTTVEVDIQLKSMGPISETDLTYSMNCYFRQSWVDQRLAFEDLELDVLSLSVSTLERIWKPDTFFFNGRRSRLHKITTPNKFVRLYRTGKVLYSARMTIQANCPMNLQDFPMDTQRCPLHFGSFGYTEQDVLYRWTESRREVTISQDLELSQFDLIRTPAGERTDHNTRGNFSQLWVSFHLRRHMGNFMIQVYGPSVLLVVLSWVSFWLNREATADRISLGVTTVLTMTFLGLEARTDLPKVPYSTALDLFLWIAYGFIFASIVQFAFVHFFTKYGYGEVYFPQPQSSSEDSDDESSESEEEVHEESPNERTALYSDHSPLTVSDPSPHGPALYIDLSPQRALPRPPPCHLAAAVLPPSGRRRKLGPRRRRRQRRPRPDSPATGSMPTQFNSVSKIDRSSRVLFPAVFLAVNTVYWYAYLSHSGRLQVVEALERSGEVTGPR